MINLLKKKAETGGLLFASVREASSVFNGSSQPVSAMLITRLNQTSSHLPADQSENTTTALSARQPFSYQHGYDN